MTEFHTFNTFAKAEWKCTHHLIALHYFFHFTLATATPLHLTHTHAHIYTHTHTLVFVLDVFMCVWCASLFPIARAGSGGGVLLSVSHLQAVNMERLGNYAREVLVRSRNSSTARPPPCLSSKGIEHMFNVFDGLMNTYFSDQILINKRNDLCRHSH